MPAGYIADATTGPSQATLITPVLVALPAAADNQPLVQIRIMTTNAVGSDEWVGVDDISVAGQTTEPSGVGAATPSIVSRGAQSLLTVTVTPGQNPQSTGLLVSADLSAIGGSASQQFFDDGVSAGDAVAGDLVFSFAATVAANTATVMHSLGAEISDDQGRSAAATIKLKVASNTVPQPLAFSQDWSDGGLIATDADWSSVPGITGFRGDDPPERRA